MDITIEILNAIRHSVPAHLEPGDNVVDVITKT